MTHSDFPKIRRRFVALTAAACVALLLCLQSCGVLDVLSVYTSLPAAFKLRSWAGRDPALHPRLKIFALDDSTYATLRRRDLTGGDWAKLLTNLAKSRPAAIITTHMFGASEFTDDGGALAAAMNRVTAHGTKVVAAAFAYPGNISYRTPLTLAAAAERDDHRTTPTRLPGWLLYGPNPEEALRFSAIGHVAYDGLGWFSPYLQLDTAEAPQGGSVATQIVPHLGLAVGDYIRTSRTGAAEGRGRPVVDRSGRTLIDVAPLRVYAGRSKSLRVLLGQDVGAETAPYVKFGDTVLIITDQFTGRANFVQTPLGPLPGGYLVAAVLSSVLSGQWLEPHGYLDWLVLLAAVAGAWIGGRARPRVACWSVPLVTLGLLIGGPLAFVYEGVISPWLVAAVAFAGTASLLCAWRVLIQLVAARLRSRLHGQEAVKLQTIVRTTQMLAHDVRKPFSVLKAAAKALASQPDPRVQIELVRKLGPELDRAITSVDSLVDEVLAIDRVSRTEATVLSVEELVLQSLRGVFAGAPESRIRLSYRFDHTSDALGDAGQWRRVLQNIFENAADALTRMSPTPAAEQTMRRLWITTRDVQDGGARTEICIGNNGVAIAPEHGDRIFEAFYTAGKADGAGLGLAIAQKIIHEHGGRIWYKSTPERGTEFFLTLPRAPGTHATPAATTLPEQADSLRALLSSKSVDVPAATVPAPGPLTPKSKPWLAILDDNPFIVEAWQAVVTDARVFPFLSPEDFWAYAAGEPDFLRQLDCVVTDFNFDRASASNGVLFAEELKARVPVRICLSSDAVLNSSVSAAIDDMIPKEPVAYAVLMNAHRPSRP